MITEVRLMVEFDEARTGWVKLELQPSESGQKIAMQAVFDFVTRLLTADKPQESDRATDG